MEPVERRKPTSTKACRYEEVWMMREEVWTMVRCGRRYVE